MRWRSRSDVTAFRVADCGGGFMAASEPGATETTFGTCCDTLGNVLESQDFEPLISVGDDGVLYTSIGIVEMEEDEAGMVEYPVVFCPFCGTRLQSDDVVNRTTKN